MSDETRMTAKATTWGSHRGISPSVVDRAYKECEAITRREARNFSYGIRLLPTPKRRALSAIYAMARRIDDIGDGELDEDEKLRRLAAVREQIRAIEKDTDHTDPVLVALAHAARTFPIPLAAFEELIDGCEMDVRGRTYDTFAELVEYARCVAGSIGRLSLGVFVGPRAGTRRSTSAGSGVVGGIDTGSGPNGPAEDGMPADPSGEPEQLADTLGIALQLTNILRDLREDRRRGRIYLPREDLKRFDCSLDLNGDGDLAFDPGFAALVRFEADRAHQWYDAGLRLLPLLDRRSRACTAAMAGIYRRLLEQIWVDPHRCRRTRISLSGRQKVAVAMRAIVWGKA